MNDVNDYDICAKHEQMPIWEKTGKCIQCSLDDVSDGVSENFLTHFLDFFKKMEWLKKVETKDIVKELDELAQKLDVIAAVVFIFIDVKSESGTKQQQP